MLWRFILREGNCSDLCFHPLKKPSSKREKGFFKKKGGKEFRGEEKGTNRFVIPFFKFFFSPLTAVNNKVNILRQQCVQEEISCDSAPCLYCLLSCVINGWVLFSIVEGIWDLERTVRSYSTVLLCSFLREQKTGTLLGTLGRVGGRKGAGAQEAERVSGTGMDKELQNPDLRGCCSLRLPISQLWVFCC